MTNVKRTKRAWEKLSTSKLLNIDDLYKIEVAKFCHKHVNGRLPLPFVSKVMPQLSQDIHSIDIRLYRVYPGYVGFFV